MTKLTDLPNIGPKVAGDLETAGISTPEELREIGAEGVRKPQLSEARKAELLKIAEVCRRVP